MHRWFGSIVLSFAAVLAAAPGAQMSLADPPAAAISSPVILDTSGFWRMHHTLSMPLIRFDDGLKPIPPAGQDVEAWKSIVAEPTAPPAQQWTDPGFDDGKWYRNTAGGICRTPYLDRLCLRGRFVVNDPAEAKGLSLTVDFYGGAIVSLNGKEIARKHLAAATSGQSALAEDYPEEAFVDEQGKLIALRGNEVLVKKASLSKETLQRIDNRTRSIQVDLPQASLRKGVNVLAIEIVRAPYHKVLDKLKVVQSYKSKEATHDMSWNTCELKRVQLTAASAKGIVSVATRPQGLQIWNSDPLANDFDMDFGDPAEPLHPISLTGARNGVYSGKIGVGSTQAIKGLQAVPGDLVGEGGQKIPASAIRVRYGLPWGVCRTTTEGCFDSTPYPAEAKPLLALAETAPAEIPVYEKKVEASRTIGDVRAITRGGWEPFFLATPNQPAPVSGAVATVWVTVKVPTDAKAGLYRGTLAVQADGKKVADVPVEIKVSSWVLPDPTDYWTWVDLVQSPDVLSLEYGVPLWSDKHFDLIAKSMRYVAEAGGRILYVPLIAHTNLGNAESMVRWIKKSDGTYDYDFSVMEKYLDVALKAGVKPQVVELNVWDLYTFEAGGKGGRFVDAEVGGQAKQGGEKGPLITILDPATGKTETVEMPVYRDPASKNLWKPLFSQLRQKMQKRGLESTMMLGMSTDDWVSKSQVQFFKDVGADLPWVSASHQRHMGDKSLYGIAGVGYQAHAFNVDIGYLKSLKGWNNPGVNTLYERWGGFPSTMVTRFRAFAEYAVTGNTRGIGRVGADYWLVVKDKRGDRRARAAERFPEASWRQLSLTSSLLAPAAESAVATPRYEAMREGVQDAEARIQIEKALYTPAAAEKLGPELVKKCQDTLLERDRARWISVATLQVGPAAEHAFAAWRGCYFAGVNGQRWFLSSDWQARSMKLYDLAAEVAAAQNK